MKLHQNKLLAPFLHLCRPEFSLQGTFSSSNHSITLKKGEASPIFFSPEMSRRVRKPNRGQHSFHGLPQAFLMFCHVFLASHREERVVCAWAAQGTSSQSSKRCGSVSAVRIYYLMFCMNAPLDQNGSPWKVNFSPVFIC